jgi:hypothetical protein
MSNTIEKRFIPSSEVELRIDQNENKPTMIVGYAAVFGKLSEDLGGFREMIRPGTFKRSIESRSDIIGNVDHENSRILARTKAGSLRLAEDSIGLRCEMDIPDTTEGRDVVENIKNGNYSGMSFAFRCVSDEFRKEGDQIYRTLTDVDLFDTAVVVMPAYSSTEVSLRSLEEWRKKEEEDDDEEENAMSKTPEDEDESELEEEAEEPSMALCIAIQIQAEALCNMPEEDEEED